MVTPCHRLENLFKGWDAEKRSDKLVTYQLTLYKKYFCAKHKVDPKLVETHFALLKRTAKKDNVEIYNSGPRKLTMQQSFDRRFA